MHENSDTQGGAAGGFDMHAPVNPGWTRTDVTATSFHSLQLHTDTHTPLRKHMFAANQSNYRQICVCVLQ